MAESQDQLNRYQLPIPEVVYPHDMPIDARDATPPPPTKPLRPPAGAPNVLVILIDDMGFGTSQTYGGPCAMPTADRVAAEGLLFTKFHTTALCSPTRQALLTGRNHHTVNMGVISELATSMPGYTGLRPDTCATIAETLRENGYSTGAFGKMHQTPPWEASPAGPFDHWPTGDGFEKFYGFIGGDCNQYAPPLYDGTTPIDQPKTVEEGYHLSEDLADQVITWVSTLHALTPDKPWFTYLAFGATHAPHHVPPEWVEPYKGKFDHGHDKQREITIARQKELGIIPEDTELTKPTDWIPAWDTLTDDDHKVAARLMETYAGFASHVDHQAGRVLDALEDLGILDDTLVFYMLGDNGASAEAGTYGTFNEMAYQNDVLMTTDDILPHLDEIGGPKSFNHFTSGWAHAMNTPYQWSKIVASHWGGTRNGMVVRWPKGFSAKGEKRHQFHHVIDLAPTILEAAGIPQPQFVNGIQQRPYEGVSMNYLFDDADANDRHITQYFEVAGNRGIYHDGWSAVTMHNLPWPDPKWKIPAFDEDVWELYGPDDHSQARDLAKKQPEKLQALRDRFLIEATKYNVLPLDDRQRERFDAAIAGRPDLLNGRTSMTLYSGMTRLSENSIPNVKNTSFSVAADVSLDSDSTNGAIIAEGGAFGGWALYCHDGKLAYTHNWLGMELYTVESDTSVPTGDHTLEMSFAYDGGGTGKGGDVTLFCDGQEIGKGHIEKTVPALFSFDDGVSVGFDDGEPVIEDYGTPKGKFEGTIKQVTVDISAEEQQIDHELVLRGKFIKQ